MQLYTSSLPTEAALRVFATQAVLTLSTGDVVVGPGGIGAKFNDASAVRTIHTWSCFPYYFNELGR